jgi:glycosyltransferase involved in cell wall biosynthesis
MVKVVIAMPIYNESEGIHEFLSELHSVFSEVDHSFIVVDDASSDNIQDIINQLVSRNHFSIIFSRNDFNLGHGPSTHRGLTLALSQDPDFVIAIDGDGQFIASEVFSAFSHFLRMDSDVLLGIRKRSKEPIYRRIVTYVTRIIVLFKTTQFPADANTPFRIYRIDALKSLLKEVPPTCLIPNLFISVLIRKHSLSFTEFNLQFIERKGKGSTGTTWGTTRVHIPSKKFILFCMKSFVQFVQFSRVSQHR